MRRINRTASSRTGFCDRSTSRRLSDRLFTWPVNCRAYSYRSTRGWIYTFEAKKKCFREEAPLHKEAASQTPRMGMGAVEEGDGGKLRSHSNKLYPGSLAGVRHPMPWHPGYPGRSLRRYSSDRDVRDNLCVFFRAFFCHHLRRPSTN